MRNTFILNLILRITVYVVILASLLFVPAGTLAWPRAWLYVGAMYLGMVALIIHLDRTDRELLVERAKPRRQKGQPLSDQIILQALIAAYHGQIVFISLDVFRFHLLPRPSWIVSSLGLAIYLIGWRIVYLSLRANTFASPVVKLQDERGHSVVDVGVYSVVRHPMYSGAILIVVGLPLCLESYAGAMLGIIPIAVVALRCVLEEKFLRQNLSGYAEYTRRVRFRMIPYLW